MMERLRRILDAIFGTWPQCKVQRRGRQEIYIDCKVKQYVWHVRLDATEEDRASIDMLAREERICPGCRMLAMDYLEQINREYQP